MGRRLALFFKKFVDRFISYRNDRIATARQYIAGLLQNRRKKNMEAMSEIVEDSDKQVLHHFISKSKWDYQGVMDETARITSDLFGESEDTALLIDATSFKKKGTHSAGVGRQWLGSVGKIDNGQVGVFSCLACDGHAVPINARLYMPESKINDKAHCKQTGVPKSQRVHRTKEEIALEQVRHAREIGVKFRWVAADAEYGSFAFATALEDDGETFVLGTKKSRCVYETAPASDATQKRSVKEIINALPDNAWERIDVRAASHGTLTFDFYRQRVWVASENGKDVREWTLLIRRNCETKDDFKYSLTNASCETSSARLAYMMSERYWIERVFQDGKQEVGMGDYQVRSYLGWHRHMALVCMAMCFIVSEKMINAKEIERLSTRDIVMLAATFLPLREKNVDDIIAEIERRKARHERVRQSKLQHAPPKVT